MQYVREQLYCYYFYLQRKRFRYNLYQVCTIKENDTNKTSEMLMSNEGNFMALLTVSKKSMLNVSVSCSFFAEQKITEYYFLLKMLYEIGPMWVLPL